MSSKHKPPDLVLFFAVLLLLAVGIVMVFSASTSTALTLPRNHPDPYYFLKQQILWLLLGFLGMYAAYKVNFHWVRKLTPWFFVFTLLLLAAVLVPGIGREAGGARRWLHWGPLGFQPSELAKIVTVLFVAWFMTRKGTLSSSFFKTVIPLYLLLLPVIALVFKEPDFGTAFLLFLTITAMVCLSGVRLSRMILLFSLSIPPGIFLMLKARYRLQRWLAFFNPWKDPLRSGYHIIQSLVALGSGGLMGEGLGGGKQKFFYLPEQHTDYIFAILGEEGGFLATSIVVFLYLLLAIRGMKIAARQQNPYTRLLAAGLTISLIGQALLNMGMVVSLVPPAGIALPFLSYGGSNLVSAMTMVGFLLNFSRLAPSRKSSVAMQEKLFLERT